MRNIGKENLANIMPRVLSLMRDTPYLNLHGKRLYFRCAIQDLNFLEENGFRFDYEQELKFDDESASYVVDVSANYLFDMFLRWQNPKFKNSYRFLNELRTPIIHFESQV